MIDDTDGRRRASREAQGPAGGRPPAGLDHRRPDLGTGLRPDDRLRRRANSTLTVAGEPLRREQARSRPDRRLLVVQNLTWATVPTAWTSILLSCLGNGPSAS
jgi:hypothetical protein